MPPKKKILTVVKLQIAAGQATPAPPVGTALGPHGINIMEFCKQYNAATESQRGTIIPAEITIYEDRSFTFITKTPPAAVLIKQKQPDQGRNDQPLEGARDRRAEDAGPERQRRQRRDEDHRGHRPVDGSHRHGVIGVAWEASEARRRPQEERMAGKKYAEALQKVDRTKQYSVQEAVGLVKELAKRKFDESVDVAIRLGVDPRKADQMVRGTVSLPHGTGKSVRVAVFAAGPSAEEAREAGADIIGAKDLADRIEKENFLDFDAAVATPDLMPVVGRLGKVLGPRGLMPNPKTGTVTTDVGRAVREIKAGKVEYRVDKSANVHVPIGKSSFEQGALAENLQTVLDEVRRAKPASSKGRYIKGVTVSSTMGPGVRVAAE